MFLRQLRAARERVGLSQEQLAQTLRATQSFISKCERGERRLDLVELRAWCAALGVPLPKFVSEWDKLVERGAAE